jgi:3D (Asp-Asp-Asp) domain-containing protein
VLKRLLLGLLLVLLLANNSYALSNSKLISKCLFVKNPKHIITATCYTYYKNTKETATGDKPKVGIIAVSRDLKKAGWEFGRKVHIEGLGVFTINDLMPKKWRQKVDIFVSNRKQAKEFGKQKLKIALL